MTSTKYQIGAAALGVIITTALVAGGAYAYQGDFSKKGPGYSPERHEAMEAAFTANDYAAWKELMPGKGRVTRTITEENFSTFAQIHNLVEEGKLEEAKALKAELGLGMRDGQGMKSGDMGRFKSGGMMGLGNTEAARAAVEAGDYEAWKAAIGDSPMAEKITAENFSKMVEAHKLMLEGKYEEARELKTEMGFNGMGRMGGMKNMFSGGMDGMRSAMSSGKKIKQRSKRKRVIKRRGKIKRR